MTDEALSLILERNARVEADKAWETSKTRRGLIAGVTYVVAGMYMSALGAHLPWLNALIPVVGIFYPRSLCQKQKRYGYKNGKKMPQCRTGTSQHRTLWGSSTMMIS